MVEATLPLQALYKYPHVLVLSVPSGYLKVIVLLFILLIRYEPHRPLCSM
jgi:hypothetical protein